MFQTVRKRAAFRFMPFYDDDNYLFVNFKQKVSLISEPFSCKTQFSSDALPDMCGMAYDRKGKRLLVYNAAGSAYLYRMPGGAPFSQAEAENQRRRRRIYDCFLERLVLVYRSGVPAVAA